MKQSISIDKYALTAELSGPAANLNKAVALMEHLVREAKPDAEAYKAYIDGILKDRADAKLNPSAVFQRGIS